MSLTRDLIDQAELLATKEPRRPKQASLRRAISTAYYALFHLLLEETGTFYASGSLSTMQPLIARSLNHGELKKVAQWFRNDWGSLPEELKTRFSNPISDDLKYFCEVFVDLQRQRHEADYNIGRSFLRIEAHLEVLRAEKAFRCWKEIRQTEEARRFLLCLLITDRWKR